MTGNLQRYKIKLKGGGPWGFRLQGGPGTGSPLTVSKVRRRSKSHNQLREGDVFISVNGIQCENLTYDQVMTIAEKTGSEFNLEIERRDDKKGQSDIEAQIKHEINCVIPPKKTTIKNSTTKITEKVTKTSTEIPELNFMTTTTETIPHPNSGSVVSESVHVDEQKKDTFIKETKLSEPTDKLDKEPDVTSDISVRTSTKVTPTTEKFEKMETEKIRKKTDNSETTVVRTDYESTTKNRPSTESPSIVPNDQQPAHTENDKDSFLKRNVTEVNEMKKTEITTTKVATTTAVDVSSVEKNIEDMFVDLKKIVEDMPDPQEVVLPFATAPISSSLAFSKFSENTDSISTKKKKMFSSSSFYEEPHAIYPTVEEQFEMAKKIAESLADDTNKKSKGANMFFKRAKRSTKWIHEGPEPSSESAPGTPDALEYPCPAFISESKENKKKFPKLKLVLDPRHPVDLASLRSTGHNISEHNVISPELCHELVRDLQSPVGKGSALFAKRKKKSSEWVVDEEKVKALMRAQELSKENSASPEIGKVKPLWDSPAYYPTVSPLTRVDPDTLAETVIAAADEKRKDSIQSIEEPLFGSCASPIIPSTPGAAYYDIYKARAPKGWPGATKCAEKPTSSVVNTAPLSTFSQYLDQAEQFPPYPSFAESPCARKYNFQNFNTLPRKWKPRQ